MAGLVFELREHEQLAVPFERGARGRSRHIRSQTYRTQTSLSIRNALQRWDDEIRAAERNSAQLNGADLQTRAKLNTAARRAGIPGDKLRMDLRGRPLTGRLASIRSTQPCVGDLMTLARRWHGLAVLVVSLAGPGLRVRADGFSGAWTRVREEDSALTPTSATGSASDERRHGAGRRRGIRRVDAPGGSAGPHGGRYFKREPSNLPITKEMEPVTRDIKAYYAEWMRQVRVPISWTAGRIPRQRTAHSWLGSPPAAGLAMSADHTTHLKESYLRRNGVPVSDKATLTEYWMRNDDILTWVIITEDPVYLTEPLIWSSNYRLNLRQQVPAYPCFSVTEIVRPRGVVPHYLPGTSDLTRFTSRRGVPPASIYGGAATMYPEFKATLRKQP